MPFCDFRLKQFYVWQREIVTRIVSFEFTVTKERKFEVESIMKVKNDRNDFPSATK